MTKRIHSWLSGLPAALLLAAMLLLAACGGPGPGSGQTAGQVEAPAAGSCSLPADETAAGDDAALAAMLRAEGALVVSQQIEALMALWDPAGEVVDAKNTPDDRADDQRWMGHDAVRHRYVRTVFPGNPQPPPADAAAPALSITYNDDGRVTVRATTQIGAEVAPAGDRWVLVHRDGCWFIESLTYNLESRE